MFYTKHYSTFEIAMMKRDGLSNIDIAKKTGQTVDEVIKALKSYESLSKTYTGASCVKSMLSKGRHTNGGAHPERRSAGNPYRTIN